MFKFKFQEVMSEERGRREERQINGRWRKRQKGDGEEMKREKGRDSLIQVDLVWRSLPLNDSPSRD